MIWRIFFIVKLFLFDKKMNRENTQGRGCGISLWELNALWYRIILNNYIILNGFSLWVLDNMGSILKPIDNERNSSGIL